MIVIAGARIWRVGQDRLGSRPASAELLVVVLSRRRLVRRLRALLGGLPVVGPLPEGRVPLNQVNPYTLPVGRHAIP